MTPVRIAPDVPIVYVDTLEALIALSQLTGKVIIWRRLARGVGSDE